MEINGMKEKLNQWFASCALAPGILGCGVRLPDDTCVSQSFNENCPRERLDQALQSLGDSLPSFSAHSLAPRWLTWTFEKGQMRVALRPDGLLLGLAIQPNTPAAENLDLLTEEFLTLDLKD
jgi:hypothetical protein